MKKETINKLIEVCKDDFEILENDLNNKSAHEKIKFRHKKCNTEYFAVPSTFMRETSSKNRCCPFCKRKNKLNSNFNNGFIKKIKEKFGNEWDILSEYTGKNNKVKVKHNICGGEYFIFPEELLRKNKNCNCKKCSKKLNIESLQNKINNCKDGNEYKIIYNENILIRSSKDKIKMKHLVCGNIYDTTISNFCGSKKIKGKRCPYCAGKRNTSDFYINRIQSEDADYKIVNLENKFINSTTKIEMKHLKCNKVFNSSYNKFIYNKHRCPYCSLKGTSQQEKEVLTFIQENEKNINIINNKRFYYNGKLFKEADIFLKDKDSIFEFDGLYWHSENKISKFNLLEKTNFFKNNYKYDVFHIFEDEWINKQKQVKNRILNLLDNDIPSNINEKYLNIEIYNTTNFLNNNSIDNFPFRVDSNLTKYICLEYSNKIIGCAAINNNEIISFASLPEYNTFIILKKLIDIYMKEFNINEILIDIDLRWGTKLFEKSFNNIEIIKYINPRKYFINRNKNKRILLNNENLSLSIYDCGAAIFNYKIL